MSCKDFVKSVYPEAHMRKIEHSFGIRYYGIFIHRKPKGTSMHYHTLLGMGKSPKSAWTDAMKEINKKMMETLES